MHPEGDPQQILRMEYIRSTYGTPKETRSRFYVKRFRRVEAVQ